MQVLGVLFMVMGAALRVGRCLRRFKWPILALLVVAPLVITWSLEVFRPQRPGSPVLAGAGKTADQAHRPKIREKEDQQEKERSSI